MGPSLLAFEEVIEFHATEAYLNLGLNKLHNDDDEDEDDDDDKDDDDDDNNNPST